MRWEGRGREDGWRVIQGRRKVEEREEGEEEREGKRKWKQDG